MATQSAFGGSDEISAKEEASTKTTTIADDSKTEGSKEADKPAAGYKTVTLE